MSACCVRLRCDKAFPPASFVRPPALLSSCVAAWSDARCWGAGLPRARAGASAAGAPGHSPRQTFGRHSRGFALAGPPCIAVGCRSIIPGGSRGDRLRGGFAWTHPLPAVRRRGWSFNSTASGPLAVGSAPCPPDFRLTAGRHCARLVPQVQSSRADSVRAVATQRFRLRSRMRLSGFGLAGPGGAATALTASSRLRRLRRWVGARALAFSVCCAAACRPLRWRASRRVFATRSPQFASPHPVLPAVSACASPSVRRPVRPPLMLAASFAACFCCPACDSGRAVAALFPLSVVPVRRFSPRLRLARAGPFRWARVPPSSGFFLPAPPPATSGLLSAAGRPFAPSVAAHSLNGARRPHALV